MSPLSPGSASVGRTAIVREKKSKDQRTERGCSSAPTEADLKTRRFWQTFGDRRTLLFLYLIYGHFRQKGSMGMNALKNARFCEVYRQNLVSVCDYPDAEQAVVTIHKKSVRQKGFFDDRGERCEQYLRIREGLEEFYAILEDREPRYAQKRTTAEESAARSLRRIKARALDIALANRFQYWVTFTVNGELCDRTNIDEIMKKFHAAVKRRNEGKRADRKVKYILFPERHADGSAYHLHGFVMGLRRDEVRRNEHGYLTIPLWSELMGFDCVTYIGKKSAEEYRKIVGYTVKYAEKAVTTCGDYKHAYYISRGLKSGDKRFLECTEEICACFEGENFENEFIRRKTFTGSDRDTILAVVELARRRDEMDNDDERDRDIRGDGDIHLPSQSRL